MKTTRAILLTLIVLWSGWRQAHAQGTAFTYQGQLSANGAPLNGQYDFTFSIFDSSNALNQIGDTLTNLATPVSNGLFMVTLDFGSGVFTGPARWLEIGVRSNATGNFTSLSPLQALTPAPYAVAAENLLNPLPASLLPNTVVTNDQTNINLSGTFNGNGSGLTNTPGTVVWQNPGGTQVQALVNNGYLLTSQQQSTVTLPVSPAIGSIVQIAGTGSGGWIVAQNAGQTIFGNFVPLWSGISAPLASWACVASSSNGMSAVAAVGGGGLYTSSSSGTNWAQQIGGPLGSWQSIASSADGTHLVAGTAVAYNAYGGSIYTSINSGSNWTQQMGAPLGFWQSVASSSDGSQLVAVDSGSGIFTSSNFGTNWTEQASAPTNANWTSVASSSDGSHLVASEWDGNTSVGGIYISSDSGVTWQLTGAPSTNQWVSVASSSDGSHLAAVIGPNPNNLGEGGGIYTSANGGTNWTLQTGAPVTVWQAIASSADGSHLVAVVNGGYLDQTSGIYTSVNDGITWTLQQQLGAVSVIGVSYISDLASSADGSHLFATANGGGIYTSVNGGTNWVQEVGAPLSPISTSTTTGTAGFLQGPMGSSVELIYTGNGNFIAVGEQGTIYDH